METYLLLNGETLNVHSAVPATLGIEKNLLEKLEEAKFFLIAEIKGGMVGYLTIKRGQKIKNTYSGEMDINIQAERLKVGIEKVLFQGLERWFNKMETVRKVQLKVKVNSLMKLELIIDLCVLKQGPSTDDGISIMMQ
ncbi:MAG: hypothetical protein H6Q75_495 [Firmicutes bacterium]|nr:hypothetical protein [Bacillota bacterium]